MLNSPEQPDGVFLAQKPETGETSRVADITDYAIALYSAWVLKNHLIKTTAVSPESPVVADVDLGTTGQKLQFISDTGLKVEFRWSAIGLITPPGFELFTRPDWKNLLYDNFGFTGQSGPRGLFTCSIQFKDGNVSIPFSLENPDLYLTQESKRNGKVPKGLRTIMDAFMILPKYLLREARNQGLYVCVTDPLYDDILHNYLAIPKKLAGEPGQVLVPVDAGILKAENIGPVQKLIQNPEGNFQPVTLILTMPSRAI